MDAPPATQSTGQRDPGLGRFLPESLSLQTSDPATLSSLESFIQDWGQGAVLLLILQSKPRDFESKVCGTRCSVHLIPVRMFHHRAPNHTVDGNPLLGKGFLLCCETSERENVLLPGGESWKSHTEPTDRSVLSILNKLAEVSSHWSTRIGVSWKGKDWEKRRMCLLDLFWVLKVRFY